ncbi:Mitochondrial ribosome-associated GTPase 2 [Eumeta japonica]|uniref:Mitochondrial ribosome-associated GTPase 2 n=1 Tax=Eumeta variegata TaxID=151549 RepID=A0A4C1TVK3_EUMVA|nr:Mitochondrial ribosome-associated GTPase 2 [Eumeta japonica]
MNTLLSYTRAIHLISVVSRRHYSDIENIPRALRSLKKKSSSHLARHFVDSFSIKVEAGSGGDGCISFLSAFAKENAGPDGGDGGNGGHVLLQATSNVNSLNHCQPVIRAASGEKGGHKDCSGKSASHVIVNVPIGTIVRDEYDNVVADLNKEGMTFVAARGGAGGRGNRFFTSSTEQAPSIAEYGAPGENFRYHLEVRSTAHAGLLGLPNAGKSTLLRAISRARPTVAPYPFTTLHPHIGMVPYDDYEQVAVADLPGLIPGSHLNRGLGIRFLQHVQRCRGLLYVIDASREDPWTQYDQLQYELEQFNVELLQRPTIVVANKIDLPEAKDQLPALKRELQKRKMHCVVPLSAKTGIGLGVLLRLLRDMYDGVLVKDNQSNSNEATDG